MDTVINARMYRTRTGRKQITDLYDMALRRYPVAYESCFVPTRFGQTHLLMCGKVDAPPLVLVHGAGINALLWVPQVEALAEHFRIYMPDIPGEGGKSQPVHMSRRNDDHINWLTDVLDAVGLERPVIGGISLGGWLALMMGFRRPERISRIIALCPAGISRVSLRFVLNVAPITVLPSRATAEQFLRGMTYKKNPLNAEFVDWVTTIFSNVRMNSSIPRRFSDAELKRIQVPTLIMLAEHEILHKARPTAQRARRLLPHAQIEVVPECSHSLNSERTEIVNEKLLEFLTETAAL